MSIRVIRQGIFDTIQDNGRYGYQHLGINPGGAMDVVAASVANMLVGNRINEAVIELHFPAATFFFEKACLIALSGADFSATVNNEIVPLNTAVIIAGSTELSFKQYKRGARCYLAVQGGWGATDWLNSYSTNIKVHAGGFHGRALKRDDILHCHAEQFMFASLPSQSYVVTKVKAATDLLYSSFNIMRCMMGRQYTWLQERSKDLFESADFTISTQSDRMAYRLKGAPLQTSAQKQFLSSAVVKGAIQLLPEGQLILLMADHQTTGGYPVIANVVSTDIPVLAQMQPGAGIRFRFITVEEAESLYMQQQQNLMQLQDDCNLQLKNFFNQ
ncbi:MAG TPA: biotin-dependent carboxyltransferase family protein [Parafilimonas sp.]|nr:biotin-dependent carboxyltransferase family protein [Parafilimonas sp.]